ncbi:MAG: beta strand repeat-containing protein [Caulobacterales bacterium]
MFSRALTLMASGLAMMLGAAPAARAQIVTDGSVGAATALTGPNFQIPENLGTRAGPNLFHSFSQFGVPQGGSAAFQGASSIERVIARVTGGAASTLAGNVFFDGPTSASLYLINPSGIVVTDTASFTVSGILAFSTANRLEFADGARVLASTGSGSTFTAAAPSAFGFLGGLSGDVKFTAASPTFRDMGVNGTRFLVNARNIEISQMTLGHQGRGVAMAAVGDQARNLAIDAALPSGLGGKISVVGGGGVNAYRGPNDTRTVGAVDLSADVMDLRGTAFNSVNISSSANTNTGFGAPDLFTSPILLKAGDLFLSDGAVGSGSSTSARTADIVLEISRSLQLLGREKNDGGTTSGIFPFGGEGSSGGGGDLIIRAPSADILLDGGRLRTGTFGTGKAGSTSIQAKSLTMQGAAGIGSGSGRAGDPGVAGSISVDVGRLAMLGGTGKFSVFISTVTSNSEPSGEINILADDILMSGPLRREPNAFYSNQISASTGSAGNGGSVTVTARNTLEMSGSDISSSGFDRGSGDSGSVRITAGFLTMRAGATLSTNSGSETGAAGDLSINAGSLTIQNSSIFSTSAPQNDGYTVRSANGAVTVQAKTITLDGADLNASNAGVLPGKDFSITADSVSIVNGSSIATSVSGSGSGGSIKIDSGNILFNNARISAGTSSSGSSGSIDIKFRDAFTVDASSILTTAFQFRFFDDQNAPLLPIGSAGSIQIASLGGALSLKAFNLISCGPNCQFDPQIASNVASSNPLSRAGDIIIDVKKFSMASAGRAFGTLDAAGNRLPHFSIVSNTNSTLGVAAAGSVRLTADDVDISGATFAQNTQNSGGGGAIQIIGRDRLRLDRVTADSSTSGSGSAGGVSLSGRQVIVTDSVISSQTSGAGSGGPITIGAGQLELIGANINSPTFASGSGGAVTIRSRDAVIIGSRINSSTSSAGSAGAITMDVRRANQLPLGVNAGPPSAIDGAGLSITDSSVTANTTGPGSGASIRVLADDLKVVRSALSASAQGAGSGGAIDLDVGRFDFVGPSASARINSISTETFGTGSAGAITIRFRQDSVLGNNASISAQSYGDLFVFSNPRSGRSGDILISGPGAKLTMDSRGGSVFTSISSDTASFNPLSRAGDVTISVDALEMLSSPNAAIDPLFGTGIPIAASIASTARGGAAPGGNVTINARRMLVSTGVISAATSTNANLRIATGDAGTVRLNISEELTMTGGSITSFTRGPGAGGRVIIDGPAARVNFGDALVSVGSDAFRPGVQLGQAGQIIANVRSLDISGGLVASINAGATPGGLIDITASERISVSSGAVTTQSTGPSAAGSLRLSTPLLQITGGRVTTNATTGAAGDITIATPPSGLILLTGTASSQAEVTTSSGSGSGGKITISNPLAIVSNGGDILALGQAGGANVNIKTTTLVRSADRLNRIQVDGALVLDSQVQDVSRGLEEDVIPLVDIGEVLKNQCRAARLTGAISALRFTGIGPFSGAPLSEAACAWSQANGN